MVFKNYTRKPHLSKEVIIKETEDLYNNQKKVFWIENPYEIKKILKNCDNPWVYHYSLNLNWVLFFTTLFEIISTKGSFSSVSEKLKYFGFDFEDLEEVYLKTWRLKIIFDHADGLIEDGDKIYIIKDDYNLIQKGLDRFTLS
jgi:hypothetical protein